MPFSPLLKQPPADGNMLTNMSLLISLGNIIHQLPPNGEKVLLSMLRKFLSPGTQALSEPFFFSYITK